MCSQCILCGPSILQEIYHPFIVGYLVTTQFSYCRLHVEGHIGCPWSHNKSEFVYKSESQWMPIYQVTCGEKLFLRIPAAVYPKACAVLDECSQLCLVSGSRHRACSDGTAAFCSWLLPLTWLGLLSPGTLNIRHPWSPLTYAGQTDSRAAHSTDTWLAE